MVKRFAVLCGLSLGLMALGVSAATLTISSNTTWNDGSPAAGYDSVTITDGATLTFEIASGTCTYSGPTITGAGVVKKTGAGTLVFSGNNTFDGDLTVEAGTFQANVAGAFGSTKGKTICKRSSTGGPLLIFGATMETSEEFDIRSDNNSGKNPQFAAGTTVTLNGNLNLNSALNNWDVPANTTVIVNGNVSKGGTWGTGASTTTSKIYWNGDFVQTTTWYFSGGCHYLKGHFTTSGNTSFNTRNGNYHFQGENVLNGTQVVHQEDANILTYYLEGYDQTCSKMGFSHANDESWNSFEINSTSGNTWHVKTGQSAIAAKFTGNVGLSCEGDTQYILKESTSTGTLTVKGGAVVEMLTAGADPYPKNTKTASWAGDVTVEANSTLKVNASSSISPLAKISVSGEGATLQLAANIVLGSEGELWLDGARAQTGVWGAVGSGAAHESAHLAGEGTITVPVRPLEITADMLDDGVYTVASAAEYSGIKVSAPATIRGAALTVLNFGTVTIGANATFECPLVFGKAANEKVTISAASGVEARFSGVISGPASITSGGVGTVYFAGANTFTGKLTVEAGKFHAVSDGAFGAADGKTVCDTGSAGAPELFFDGITTAEPLSLASGNSKIHFVGENTFNADIELTKSSNGNQQQWDFQKGSKTVFNGALKDVDNCALFMGFVKNETPWGEIFFNGGVTIQNVWYFQRGIIHYGGTVSANKFRARGPMTAYLECAQLSTVDIAQEDQSGNLSYVLDACDSSITGIARGSANNGGEATRGNKMMSFTSKNGYTLHVTGANKTDSIFYGTFTGNVGASFEGAGSEIVLGGANTSTGTLTAKNGHVVRFAPSSTYTGLSDTGSWAGEISVEAGSTVELNSAANLTQTTDIRVAGEGATLQLNANVALVGSCGLWFDGERVEAGVWGKIGSGAAHESAHISGTGTITVPARPLEITADMLDKDGVYTVTEPVEYSGIRVSVPATIRGAALTVLDLGTVTVNANATFECPLVFGKAANESVSISTASGVEARFSGVISGPASITSGGAGKVYFSGANTFAGALTVESGSFYADSDGAFGAATGMTICDSTSAGAPHLYIRGITTSEPFRLSATSGDKRIHFSGENTLNGAVEISPAGNQAWDFQSSSKTTFNGAISSANGVNFMGYGADNTTSEIFFNGGVSVPGIWYFQRGATHFGTTLSASSWRARGSQTVYLECAQLCTCNVRQEDLAGSISYVLNTCDSSIPGIDRGSSNNGNTDAEKASILANTMLTFTSANGYTLHVTGANKTDSLFYGTFTGNVGASFEGAGSAIVLGGANTSTGTLTAKNGHVVRFAPSSTYTGLSDTGSWAGEISVEAGSTVELNSAANLTATTKIRVTGENAKLQLNADAILGGAGELWLGDEKATSGEWGSVESGAAHTSEYLSGTGKITVPAQPLVITEDMLEDGVYTATEPKEYSAIIVSSPATIRGAALTIAGIDGLAVNANATFENALVVGKAANAQIQINVATNVELHVTGVVSGPSDIVTAGEGSIFFSGANTFDGNLTIGGKVIFYADSDAAFGSTAGWTKCDTDTGANLHFRGADGLGIATAEPFFLHDTSKGRIWFDGLTNALNGSITLTGAGFNWWQFPKASTTSFNCPVTNATGATAGFWGNGFRSGEATVPPFAKIHWNGPVKCAQQFYFDSGDHYIDGNLGGSFAGLAQFNPRGGNYFFSGPNALGPDVYLLPESGLAQNHRFSGCDQTIGYFFHKNEAGLGQPEYYVESTDGCALNVVNTTQDQTCLAVCKGNVSLNFVGSKNVDILRASTSTGMLSVVSGATAKFSSTKKLSNIDFTGLTGSWAGDVTVGSDSKLTLAANAFTGRKGTLFIEGNGVIDIPAGLEVRVGSLRINGELQPRGYYGATVDGLDAAVKAHFTGEGVLRAVHGNQGAVLIVR